MHVARVVGRDEGLDSQNNMRRCLAGHKTHCTASGQRADEPWFAAAHSKAGGWSNTRAVRNNGGQDAPKTVWPLILRTTPCELDLPKAQTGTKGCPGPQPP